jgi:crotonobetainyl-CoA:carnitine CoA-transferase CaiB-like acyl-CoA transferase
MITIIIMDKEKVANADDLPPGPLAGLRVLDQSGPLGNYCGKLFADLGADVILVESPDGTPLRHEPPFLGPGDAESIPFLYMNSGKRSLCLDLEQPTDAAILRELARRADLVVESERPGTAQRRGLGWSALSEGHPELVLTSITPFGQDGPYAGRAGDDLIANALGGLLYLGGYADGGPLRPAGDQAVLAASLFAAVASMLALTHAEITGQGQHVDVSMMEAVVMGLENSPQYYDLEGVVRRRTGGVQRLAGTGVFGCADGLVCLLATGFGGTQHWTKLVTWLEAETGADLGRFRDPDWSRQEFLASEAAKAEFSSFFAEFCRSRTQRCLYLQAQRWRVPLCPVSAPRDVLADEQLAFRRYFAEVTRPDGSVLVMPGAPYRFSLTPWRITRPAPRLGQHTAEILAEAGLRSPADAPAARGAS